jgi:ABC-type uncharacterized transport system fused permease/ATPase subunit
VTSCSPYSTRHPFLTRTVWLAGTLRDQLIYPLTADEEEQPLTDLRMQELLAMVDLEYLLGRYGPHEEVNWGEVSHREPGI